jgi:glycosyltransferase involved in cell wall biosynthesis
MTPPSPTVTVVIPSRNRWPFLSRTIASALAQAGVDIELLVVDDGSTDETPAALAEVDDPRLRVLRNDQSAGVAAARNRGIDESRGEWIAFLDDDDFWSPDKLRLQLATAALTDADFVYSAIVQITDEGDYISTQPAPAPSELRLQLLNQNVMPAGASNVVARSDLVRRVDGFDTELFQLADWDLWIRLAEAGRPAACADVLVAYVKHAQNMLVLREQDIFEEARYLAAKHRAAGDGAGIDLDPVPLSRWMALEHLRSGRRREAVRTYIRAAVAYRDLGNVARAVGVTMGARPDYMRREGGNEFLPDWLSAAE